MAPTGGTVVGSMLVVACLLMAGCTGSAATSNHSETDLRSATLRVEVESCREVSRQWATAVVLEPPSSAAPGTTVDASARPDELAVAATVAHTFTTNGEVTTRDFTVHDPEGGQLDARLTFIDPLTDVALLTLSVPRPGLTVGSFLEPDATSRVVRYPESGTTPTVEEIAVVRETTATLDGAGSRRVLELGGSVDAGDSGAPVVDDLGHVIGLVFATNTGSETSWAIATSEFEEAMAQAAESVELTCE